MPTGLESIGAVDRGELPCAVVHASVDTEDVQRELRHTQSVRMDLVCADLPFCTGDTFEMERDGSKVVAYKDVYDSPEEWAEAMALLVRSVGHNVSRGGSIVLHVDWRYSHLLRLEVDRVLRPYGFSIANEIVWRYRRMPSKSNAFQNVHDTLYRWVKRGEAPIFNQLYEPLAPSTVKQWGTKKQKAITNDAGQRVKSSTLEEESPGVRLGDVWDIGIIAPSADERTGYPTQKPLLLYERLVIALSKPSGLVVDLTCGSGTTLIAALKHGRRAIGFDTSPVAVEVARSRIEAFCAEHVALDGRSG